MSAPLELQIFLGLLLFVLIFVPLEQRFPRRTQRLFRTGWLTDVVYYALGCAVGKLSDAASMTVILIARDMADWNPHGVVAHQPAWVQFFQILILADFLAYWFHRSVHRFSCLWRFHCVHHSSRQMDWLANVRLHPVDKFLGDCAQLIPIFFLGFAEAPLLAYLIVLGFQGFLNHSNIRLRLGPLRWLIAGPQFHHWHHSDSPEAQNKNFAQHLVVFDLLFGTAYLPPEASVPSAYGVAEPVPPAFWAQLVSPFRSRAAGAASKRLR